MLRIGTNHHDLAVTANNTALLANFADRGPDFHAEWLLFYKRNIISDYLLSVNHQVLSVGYYCRPRSKALNLAFAKAISNSTLGQVIGRQFHLDAIARQDLNVIAADLARDMGQDIEAVIQINSKHGIGQGLSNSPLHFNEVLLRQFPSSSTLQYSVNSAIFYIESTSFQGCDQDQSWQARPNGKLDLRRSAL